MTSNYNTLSVLSQGLSDSESEEDRAKLSPLLYQNSLTQMTPSQSVLSAVSMSQSSQAVQGLLSLTASQPQPSQEVEVVAAPKEKTKKASKIAGATFADVVVTTDPINKVSSTTKSLGNTRLKSIKGWKIEDIGVRELRTFCRDNSVQRSRVGKDKLCEHLVGCKAQWDNKKENGTPVPVEEDPQEKVRVRNKRYINVLFSEKIRPLLALRGEPLNKDEITSSMKTDDNLHKAIVDEYNEASKYFDDAFPLVEYNSAATLEKKIGITKSKSNLKSLIAKHEKAFINWKKSGNHANFEDFTKEKVMMYFHEFTELYPEALTAMSAHLVEGAFRESTCGTNSDETKTPAKTPNSKNRGRGKSPPQHELDVATSAKKRNDAEAEKNIQKKLQIQDERDHSLQKSIQKNQDKRSQLFEKVVAKTGKSRKAIDSKYEVFAADKKEAEDNDEPFNRRLFSQGSDFERIYETEESIRFEQKKLKKLRKSVDY